MNPSPIISPIEAFWMSGHHLNKHLDKLGSQVINKKGILPVYPQYIGLSPS